MSTSGIAILTRDTSPYVPTFLGEHTRPACKTAGVDPEWWFPVSHYNGPTTAKARLICTGCPLREPCADWAADRGEQWGIWGALDPAQLATRRKQWRPL